MKKFNAEKLRQLMNKNGETAYRLAKKLGITQNTVTGWLNGRQPRVRNVRELASYYEVEPEDFYKEEEG